MATIRKRVEVAADIEAVWAKIADVGGISKLIGYIETSEMEGNNLVCKLSNGAKLVERLISLDEGLKRVVLSITESPGKLDFHVACMELEVIEVGTRLIWTIDVLPVEAVPQMEMMLDSAVKDLQKTLAD